MGKQSRERRGLLPRVLDVTPAANAWLNPTMDDDSDQDSNDLGDDMLFPTTTAHLRLKWMEKEEKTHLQMELRLQVSK